MPPHPTPPAQQTTQPWTCSSLRLPAASGWQAARPPGCPAGFAAHQTAPNWHSPGRKRAAEAPLPQAAAQPLRSVRPRRSQAGATTAQSPAATSQPLWSSQLPLSPSAAMLHGCSQAELAPIKPLGSALLTAGSVPVPAAPAPRPALARCSSGSGRSTPVDDCGSASSSPRGSYRCGAAHPAFARQCGRVPVHIGPQGRVACPRQLSALHPPLELAPARPASTTNPCCAPLPTPLLLQLRPGSPGSHRVSS